MAQIFRVPFQRVEQVAQHPVVGLDLLALPPAGNQSGTFVQSGINQMRHAGQTCGQLLAGSGVGQVQRQEARAMGIVGLPPRQGDDVAIGIGAEMPHRGITYQPAGAGDQDLFAWHGSGLMRCGRVAGLYVCIERVLPRRARRIRLLRSE